MAAKQKEGTSLPKNLKSLRNVYGLSQKDVADDLKIPLSTYQGWESGNRQPDLSKLVKISRYFGVTLDKLIYSTERALKIGTYFTAVDGFHPIRNPAGVYNEIIYKLLFNHLFYYDKFARRVYVELADSWHVNRSDGNLGYKFYLHGDARFHNSALLTPQDVKESYDLFRELNPFYNHFITEVLALDKERAIELKLSKWLEFEYLPTPYIIPASEINENECFTGTGPYKITDEEQKKGVLGGLKEPVTLECNEDYFGKIAPIPAIEIHRFDKLEELKASLKAAELDLGYNVELDESDTPKFESEYDQSIISFYLILDQNSEIFKDADFRKAVDFAIDRKKIVEVIGPKRSKPLPDFHLYLILRNEDTNGHYNPAEAKECFDRAKASLSSREIADLTVYISSYVDEPVVSKLKEEVIKQLSQAGIEAKENREKANAWVAVIPFSAPHTIYSALHLSQKQNRPWQYKSVDKSLDELLDQINSEGMDMRIYQQIQDVLSSERLFLPLCRQGVVITHTRELETNSRLRATNPLFSQDIVHFEFKEPE